MNRIVQTIAAVAVMVMLAIVGVPTAFAQGEITLPVPPPPPVPDKALTGSLNGHEWVDLGLPSGLKWATCNVGATSPGAYGDYFAWGETSSKENFTNDNSITYGRSVDDLKSGGIIKSAGVLTRAHDAASANWGSTWRMPTKAEFDELLSKCSWKWATEGGHNGYRVTGPNGKSIFFPAAGWRYGTSHGSADTSGRYWSSTVYEGTYSAYSLNFDSGNQGTYWGFRSIGVSVRPVTE